MKTFEEFRFSIPHNKVKTKVYTLYPKTYDDLVKAIKDEVNQHGPEADLNCIDTSAIDNMDGIFNCTRYQYLKDFNGDVSGWDVSNVKDMHFMFFSAEKFNGDISKWNVSNVTDMSGMFLYAKSFNGDISKWDVSNVKNMATMFGYAINFNCDISGWNTSSLRSMDSMFFNAREFNQDISGWDMHNINYSNLVFDGCFIKDEYKPKIK